MGKSLENTQKSLLTCRGRLNVRYSRRKYLARPNPFRGVRTRGGLSRWQAPSQSTPAAVSSHDLQLQQMWSEALNPHEVEQAILGSVMEDILQEAIVQTIPEVIAEVSQEVWEEQERLALQHAQVLVEGAMPKSDEARSLMASLGSSAGAPPPSELSEVPQTSAEDTMVTGSSGASGTAATEGARGEEGGSMEVSVQVEPTPGGGETAAGDSEEERLKDWFIQGTIAPKLTVVEQERLRKQGVYLVVATKVADNLFVTQLMHESLTVKQQAEIRQAEGEVLITHNPDDYEAAHMNLDTQWLEQIKLRNEQSKNLPSRALEETQETMGE